MFQPKRILVPVDFSDCSRAALSQAVALSRRFGAELRVVHVYDPPYFGAEAFINLPGQPPVALVDYVCDQMTRQLDTFLTPVRADASLAPRLESRVTPGVPFETIPDVAATWNADLVVMGTHGRRGFKHWLLGSVAEQVIRDASCPVLVVRATMPGEREPPPLGPILVAVAFDQDDEISARTALDLAAGTEAAVTLLHVVPVSESLLDEAIAGGEGWRLPRPVASEEDQARLAALGGRIATPGGTPPTLQVVHGSPARQIITVAQETGARLIVMGTRSRRGLAHLLIGSVTQQVLRGAPCAVLVTRSTEKGGTR